MSTPSITPQAVGAFIIVALVNAEILFGVTLKPAKEAALETIINGAAILGFLAHDAIIRHGRAKVAAAQAYAAPAAPVAVPPTTPAA